MHTAKVTILGNVNQNTPIINGKTVPVERRNQVRLSKADVDTPKAAAVSYKIATEKHELENAYSLVWNNYVETGLQKPDDIGIRFTKYHLLPNTRVFIANYHKELEEGRPDKFKGDGICVGTVTLVMDGPMGLPMEEFCSEEIKQMRQNGSRMAEVVAFAVNPTYAKYKVFLHMFKLLFQFAEMKGITDLCCSVTQRHIKFYRRVCLFEPMGELVPYSAAYKLKVQGHKLNIKEANRKAEEFYGGREFDADLHRFFFNESFNRKKGEGRPLTSEELNYFVKERTNFIDSLEDGELDVLRTEYEQVGVTFPF